MNKLPRQVQVHVVNAFVCDGTGGNPAGVVLDADDLDADDRLEGTDFPLAQGPNLRDLARSLGLAASVLLAASDSACIMSTGNRFLLVQVPEAQHLSLLRPMRDLMADISESLDLIGLYVDALQPGDPAVATTRMFAPRYGIPEEAGTGMAAGPLA